jgi:hypothetical protein
MAHFNQRLNRYDCQSFYIFGEKVGMGSFLISPLKTSYVQSNI